LSSDHGGKVTQPIYAAGGMASHSAQVGAQAGSTAGFYILQESALA